MKVLILVMSSSVQGYPALEKLQMETWDSIPHPDVQTLYYLAGPRTRLVGNKLYISGGEDWKNFFTRTVKAFKEVLHLEWDYIFKTDNSAYVNKEELVKILDSQPRKKFFGGKLYVQTSPMNATNFFWGEGYALSRDVVEHLIVLASKQESLTGMDDMIVSKLLYGKYEFTSLPMYEYYRDDRPIPFCHIYRCKRGLGKNHSDEISAITDVHKYLTSQSSDVKKGD